MAETLAEGITAATLRVAIRNKLDAGGVGKRAITVLINDYAVSGPPDKERIEMGTPRRPVENIPYGRRAAFLEALDALKGDISLFPRTVFLSRTVSDKKTL